MNKILRIEDNMNNPKTIQQSLSDKLLLFDLVLVISFLCDSIFTHIFLPMKEPHDRALFIVRETESQFFVKSPNIQHLTKSMIYAYRMLQIC
jgi:hypothetical protein